MYKTQLNIHSTSGIAIRTLSLETFSMLIIARAVIVDAKKNLLIAWVS